MQQCIHVLCASGLLGRKAFDGIGHLQTAGSTADDDSISTNLIIHISDEYCEAFHIHPYIYGRKQNVLGLGVLAPNATEYVLYVVQHLSDVANESQCWGTCWARWKRIFIDAVKSQRSLEWKLGYFRRSAMLSNEESRQQQQQQQQWWWWANAILVLLYCVVCMRELQMCNCNAYRHNK